MLRCMVWWEYCIAALGAVFLCWVGYVLYGAFTAETFALRKDQWTCTAHHTAHTIQMVNKVPVTMPRTVCDRYERKGT